MKHFGLPILGLIFIIGFLLWGISNIANESLLPFGKVTYASVNVTRANPANCSITIPAGTNQLSFFCLPNGITITNALENFSFKTIRTYDNTDASDPWKVQNPGLPSWVINDLETLQRTEAYILETNTSQYYFFEGGVRGPNSIPLTPGWNYVGYPTNETRHRTQSFSSINDSYTEIRSYNNTNFSYAIYIPPNSGDLQYTIAYQAYWINANRSDTWIVD